jgi:hypothetical protein
MGIGALMEFEIQRTFEVLMGFGAFMGFGALMDFGILMAFEVFSLVLDVFFNGVLMLIFLS